jgi:hypothetical protein
MFISREKVERIVAMALSEINGKRKNKEVFTNKMKERGFSTGEAISILTGQNPLIQITDELLYLLVYICHGVVKSEDIQQKLTPDRILTDKEIEIAKQIKMERKSDSIYPVVIENVNLDMEDDFSTIFTIEKLSEYFDNRLIKYNSETQRPLISKWYNNQEVKEVFVNDKNRKAIERNILEGKQVSNYITLNILANGEEDFSYNSDKRTLTIYSGEIDLLDGFHRTLAGRNAFHRDPSVKFNYKIRVVHWDVEKAKAFIHQESLGTQLDPLAKKTYDVYNEVNQVVHKLNENPKSIFRNKITTEKSKLDNGNALIMFDLVFDCIDHLFKVKNNKDVIVVSNYIQNVMSSIVFNDINILDQVIDPRLFITYMIIASLNFGKEEWEESVFMQVSKIDKSYIESLEFKKLNKTFINKIKQYITEGQV